MKIRAHVIWLVAAAVLPVMIFSMIMTVVFWRQQRAAFEDRFLERVRAVSIALDREHEASISALRGLAESSSLASGDFERFRSRAEQSLRGEQSWSAVILLDPGGQQLVHVPATSGAALPSLHDNVTFRRVVSTREAAISSLVTSAGSGRYATSIAVPVMRADEIQYVLLAEIDQKTWLHFLSLYPVAPGATMTLLDQNRIVIARTLNDEQSVGRPPAPGLDTKSAQAPLAAYRSMGLEGQWFYSAHSRASLSNWTVATGVPVAFVEGSLRGSLIAMLLGIAGTGLLAIMLVIVFGRRIERPVRRLAELARSLGRFDTVPMRVPPSNVREVDEVAETLVEASALIRRRSAERDEALAKERAARAEAESASRSKDEFLAMLGHELRNPLGAISSAAAVLEHPGTSAAAAAQAREVITRQMSHLGGIVDDLLDVARVTTGKISLRREVADVGSIVQRCLETLRSTGRLAGHEVALEAEPVWAEVDVTRIEQVLTNLLVNAVKYTPVSGTITVSIRPESDDAVLSVRDTGIGIVPTMLPRVFDLFVQSDRALDHAQGGLGIGLTLVKRMVELHGGSVSVTSAGAGQGTTFTVRLPRVAPPASPASGRPAVKVQAGSRRVLIVEDNDDARDMLRSMLSLWGHEVEGACDADGAISYVKEWRPDMALVDIGLPRRDGYQLAREIRNSIEGREVFLVAVTGYGQPEDHGRAMDAGFDAHLVKPVDPDRLAALIASARQRKP
jgi:signal transduction histidine kinase/ActR/RegA family two-component response regulator